MPSKFRVNFSDRLSAIDRAQWQSTINCDFPFIQYDFLLALEESGSVSEASGWLPCHMTLWDNDKMVALMPLYIKTHSYGEYVFDFQWANAYHQSGREYYPKLVTAIPFTPASGRRIYIGKNYLTNVTDIYSQAIESIKRFAEENHCHSWHVLFSTEEESHAFKAANMMMRLGMQYHWLNRNYESFDDFLADCKIKKRKNIRRERLAIQKSGVTIKILSGEQISESLWQRFYLFYQLTYAKRSGHGGYLNEAFFHLIGESMKSQLMMTCAVQNEALVAAALMFYDTTTLYGRYWGCSKEIEFLHFELCYYLGIELCIKHGFHRFDAGAQGEHKIARGFSPQITYSNHWIADTAFNDAIAHYLIEEAKEIKEIIQIASLNLPFKV